MNKHTNHLIHESSPYLLQHAHNPVHWEAWKTETLDQAKKENKLILLSIGYSSCHWCHVMAHESFEDEETAKIMNQHFINIKVDREERPDVDQVYMNALQLMTRRGGWPLNIIALPDGRPVWGGTYLPKKQWKGTLYQLHDLYQKDPEKMIEYAEKLEQGIQGMEEVVQVEKERNFDPELIETLLAAWKTRFDHDLGGTLQVPKFMMPNNYHFLLCYAFQTKNDELMEYVVDTLNKISYGGVFDHIGGGFSRYSTDAKWHIPHFEKMLYDNAQLVSLYCDAFLVTKVSWYQKVVFDILNFVERELTTDEGAFYSALDADSLNAHGISEEGAYYVWKKEELQNLLKEDFAVFSAYYNINEYGYWENDKYVLIRKEKEAVIAEKFSLTEKTLHEKIEVCNEKLFNERARRNPPGLDDKSLTSWNAMMLKAYCDAFRVFGKEKHLEAALKNADFLLQNQLKSDGSLYRNYKDGKSSINGYLEDYAFVIEAFITLYENIFDEKWLETAKNLTETVFENFFDTKKSMFFFTSKEDEALIARTTDFQDNVLPSSNSVMAKNLFKLSHYFNEQKYREAAEQMLKNMLPQIGNYPEAFSNWLDLLLNFTEDFYEVAIVGDRAMEKMRKLNAHYLPNKLIAGSKKKNEMPLLKNRFQQNKTPIYICVENTCKIPTEDVESALKQML